MLEYQGENDLRGMIPLSDPNLSDDRRESTSMNQLAAPLESSIDYSLRDILHHWASSPLESFIDYSLWDILHH